jgi:hypothetical protein
MHYYALLYRTIGRLYAALHAQSLALCTNDRVTAMPVYSLLALVRLEGRVAFMVKQGLKQMSI